MAPNKVMNADQSLIDQLCGIANVSRIVAANLLEACDNNLEMAINMQMEDSNGASSTQNDDDFVRAPIPKKREILVQGPDQLSYSFGGRSRIDRFRDFEAEARRQEEEVREENGSSSSSSSSQASSSSGNPTNQRKMRSFGDLFRPPFDLMYRGNFESAKDAGITSKKWLMVNVQNSSNFACQKLNRDVWSNSTVKSIIRENFIFWQVYHDSHDGLRYTTFYPGNTWPSVAIIDPRTGEKLVQWRNIDAVSFCDLITEFLAAQPSMDDDGFGISKTSSKWKMKSNESIIEADENAQIEAAIRASLESSTSKTNKNARKITGESSSDEEEDSLETFDSDEEPLGPVKKKERGTPPADHEDAMQVCPSTKAIVEETSDAERSVISSENSSTCNSSGIIPLVPYKKRRHVSKLNEEVESHDDESDCSFEMANEKDKWKLYLGKESDPLSKLILRLPDGTRQCVEMPKSSKLMALVLYVSSKGFSNESYEMVTNFPRRKISYMNFDSTLESVGLYPQETIFVQER